MKLSKINECFETFILKKLIKCESQREKKKKIYQIIKKKELIMFINILWLTWFYFAIKKLK